MTATARSWSREIEKLKEELGADRASIIEVEKQIAIIRSRLSEIDTMTWSERNVTGGENHLWLVRSSDMLGNITGHIPKRQVIL